MAVTIQLSNTRKRIIKSSFRLYLALKRFCLCRNSTGLFDNVKILQPFYDKHLLLLQRDPCINREPNLEIDPLK